VPPDRLLDRHRRVHCVGRSGERGHDPVTEILDDLSPVRLDDARQQPVVLVAQLLGRVLAQPRTELGRPHQVREEDDGG
jgi:hypothetical protein